MRHGDPYGGPEVDAERGLTPGRAVLAEDDPGVREVLKLLLESQGWLVDVAADGREALGLAKTVGPDVVVTDLRMAGMSGLELALELADHPPLEDIPIVAITSDTSGLRAAAERSGRFVHVMTKPLEPTLFLDAVRAASGARPPPA